MLSLVVFVSFFAAALAIGELDFSKYRNPEFPTALAATAGSSIAFSADGSHCAVGNPSTGYVNVFVRSGSTWSLSGTFGSGAAGYGTSVALSEDGVMIIVGSPTANAVHTIDHGVDSQLNFPVPGTGALSKLGQSVSVSADGTKFVASAEYGTIGACYTYDSVTGNYLKSDVSNSAPAVSMSADGLTVAVGTTELSGGVGGFAVVTVAADFLTHTIVTGHTGTGNEGNSAQGTSVAISGNGKVIAVGGPLDSTTLANGLVTQVGAVWMWSVNEANVWQQMTNKLVGNEFIPNVNPGGVGATVSIDYRGEAIVATSATDNGIGASWIFARNGHDVFHWGQQDRKLEVASSAAAISGNGNEIGVVSMSGMHMYKEAYHMRIKLKLWGLDLPLADETSVYHAKLVTAFANALSVDESAITRIGYRVMTGHAATDVEAVANVVAHTHDFTILGPVDEYYRRVLSALAGGSFIATVHEAGVCAHIGDVQVRTLFGTGF